MKPLDRKNFVILTKNSLEIPVIFNKFSIFLIKNENVQRNDPIQIQRMNEICKYNSNKNCKIPWKKSMEKIIKSNYIFIIIIIIICNISLINFVKNGIN